MRLAVLLGVIGSGAFACGADERSLGDECGRDSQCEGGLTCQANLVGGRCLTTKTCTTPCAGDADCQALNPKGKCFEGCANDRLCMLTP